VAQPKHPEVLRGVDVSSFQHLGGKSIDWQALVRDGIRFTGIKVSEGTYYANPYYSTDAGAARAAGLDVLPYVFANPRDSGGAATAAFAIGVSAYHKGSRTLPLAVDLENDPYSAKGKPGNCYGLGRSSMVAWIKEFTTEVKELTGTQPIIYTSASWWQQCTGDTSQFQRSSLWVAEYGVQQPTVPQPWDNWTFWQYSNGGSLPGVGMTDLDYFRTMASGLR
jgi:GH25 family lysozyme M1 (1,4-beta-N-acetylmuramidase)